MEWNEVLINRTGGKEKSGSSRQGRDLRFFRARPGEACGGAECALTARRLHSWLADRERRAFCRHQRSYGISQRANRRTPGSKGIEDGRPAPIRPTMSGICHGDEEGHDVSCPYGKGLKKGIIPTSRDKFRVAMQTKKGTMYRAPTAGIKEGNDPDPVGISSELPRRLRRARCIVPLRQGLKKGTIPTQSG